MQIRPYRDSDRDALRAGLNTDGNEDALHPVGSSEAGEVAVRLVAEVDGEIAGYIQSGSGVVQAEPVVNVLEMASVAVGTCLELSWLAVKPGLRRRGIGRQLLRAAAVEAWETGRQPVAVTGVRSDAVWVLRAEQWCEVGSFTGDSGEEHLVFLAPEPGRRQTEYVHSGVRAGEIGAVATGIEVSTTYTLREPGQYGEFAYARSQNPTRKALEDALGRAEGGGRAMAFSSGLAAIDAVLRLLNPGESVLIGEDAYGGTWRLLDKVWKKHGIQTRIVNLRDPSAVEAGWDETVKMIMLETPSNPRMQVADISALAAITRGRGAVLVVDNTFATPHLQRPLDLGADVVVHSATKYLGGHSDVIAGALVTRRDDLASEFVFTQKAVGAVPGPFDSFLVLRGLRTLGVRVERQSSTAGKLAAMLANHEQVERVHYPGLVSHEDHAVAARQMSGFGGMISIEVRGGAEAAKRVAMSTEVFALAESLGAVESLIEHPYSMTHAANNDSKLVVPEGLLRLSIGLEEPWVLATDLHRALSRA